MKVFVRSFDYQHGGKTHKSYNCVEVKHIKEVRKISTLVFYDGRKEDHPTANIEFNLPKGAFDVTNLDVLPMYDNLAEDLPARIIHMAKVYNNAQVLVKDKLTSGNMNYMHYKHRDSDKPLMVAINSHIII